MFTSSPPQSVYGVDFSGAARAGETIWVARLRSRRAFPWAVAGLWRLADRTGRAERAAALAALVRWITRTHSAVWGFDFPFGLPVGLGFGGWPGVVRAVSRWDGGAYAFGVECVTRAEALFGTKHIRRQTDGLAPFDPVHYRVIYQTFHGIRDVLGPLRADPATAVLPFQDASAAGVRRVAIETCTTAALKSWGLPHQRYKEPTAATVSRTGRAVRQTILRGLKPFVEVPSPIRRVIMADPGGDALDAVVASVAAARAWTRGDHPAKTPSRLGKREGVQWY